MQLIRKQADIEAGLAILCGQDRNLAAIRARTGTVPLRSSPAGFAGLTSIVVSQHVSRASAGAVFARLGKLANPLEAATILEGGPDLLRLAGLTRPKQKTLLAVAAAVHSRQLDLEAVCGMKPQVAISRLTALPGIGPWTAETYLMFCAGHADIFPAGDLALREAARQALGLAARPDERELRAIASAWSPWRSVAARLLWAYYAQTKGGPDSMPA